MRNSPPFQTNIYLFSNTGSAAHHRLQYLGNFLSQKQLLRTSLDSLSAWTCWYCSSESVPKNTHSCMGPLSNVWRQERNVESVAGPGPRPPTGWDTLTKMTYDVCSPQPGQPQLMVWCLIQTWRGTTISSWCTPCTPPWTWSWYPDTHPGLDCRHMAAPT